MGSTKQLPHHVDRYKGVCRMLRPPDDGSSGPKQPCLEHHEKGERCPHTDAAHVHVTQLEWNVHLAGLEQEHPDNHPSRASLPAPPPFVEPAAVVADSHPA